MTIVFPEPVRIELITNGYHFNALSVGPKGGDVVLFLHGFPQFADAWLPIMKAVAREGFHAVAVEQRGYSPGARPLNTNDYKIEHLASDVLGFAEELGAESFHLVGHDWGGLVAWQVAAEFPQRLRSLTVLSTPHNDAVLSAIATDADQRERSRYIDFFRQPGHVAEHEMLANNATRLRSVYKGRLSDTAIDENVRRFSEDGALTAVLNWYRALDFQARIGEITVPTLFIWGSSDHALGETAARNTAHFVTAPYRFEVLDDKSHWLLEEAPDLIAPLLLGHLRHSS
jgi:pimeloyl-ACP methyl ester carboxylesterase